MKVTFEVSFNVPDDYRVLDLILLLHHIQYSLQDRISGDPKVRLKTFLGVGKKGCPKTPSKKFKLTSNPTT
jgi:hypothetical protein